MIWLILLAPVALAAGLATVTSPRRTAWLIGFTLATNAADVLRQRFDVEEYTNPLALAALGFGFLQLLASLPRLQRPRILPLGMAAATALAVVSALAGPFVAIRPADSVEATTRLLITLFLAAAVLVVTRREAGLLALLKGFALGTAILGVITTVQYLTGLTDQDLLGFARWNSEQVAGLGDTIRASGAYRDDANQYGQVLVMGIGCTVGLGWLRRRDSLLLTLLSRGSVAAMAFAITQTASRTGLLSLAMLLFAILVLARPTPRQWAVVGLALLVLLLGPFGVRDRMASIADLPALLDRTTSVESSASGRASAVLSAFDMFEDNPILGVGYGAFNDRYLEYSRSFGLDSRSRDLSAHSLPLEVMAEEGLVGLTAWFAFVVFAVVALMRIRHTTVGRSLALMLVAYISTGLLLHDIYGRLRWALVAMLFHAARLASQRASDYLPLRVAVITDEGLSVLRGHKKTKFQRRAVDDEIELGLVGTVSIWPDLRRLRSRDLIGDSNSELLNQWRNRVATRIALFRFDPHIIHSMGGSSTLGTAVAHRREMGGRLIVHLTDLLRIELLRGRRRFTAGRLIPKADYVVVESPLDEWESRLLGIPHEVQLTDGRLADRRLGAEDVVYTVDDYRKLLRGEPGNGRRVGPQLADGQPADDDRRPVSV